MSTSAISPTSSFDYGSTSATASQQSVLNNVLSQLEQSIGSGDLTGAQTYLNAFEALSPSSASGNNALGTFLTSVGTALQDGSTAGAQGALAAYQSATASSTAPASSSSASGTGSAAGIAGGLILSQIQLNLVSSLLGAGSADSSSSPDSSSSSLGSVLNILNAAYGTGSGSSADASSSSANSTSSSANSSNPASSSSSSPYDTLVPAIQASLSAGTDPASTALAYLNPNGNYVNTTA